MSGHEPVPEAVASFEQRLRAALVDWRRSCVVLAGFVVLLSLCFAKPLLDMGRYVLKSELYSHVPLVPLISLYLIWLRRRQLAEAPRLGWGWAAVPAVGGAVVLASYGWMRLAGVKLAKDDYLALTLGSFVCWVVAGAMAIVGTRRIRLVAFPVSFLVFVIPFPLAVTQWIEQFFQHATSWVAHGLFVLSGTPVLRIGTNFQLPGFALRVAEECSGIRSSLVLFMTSLLAGYLFLRTGWKRWVLALAVVPIGIVRNAFRVFTIAMLCVHVDLRMIDSPLHRRGGPVFFLLSLLPFFLLLLWLRWTEKKAVGSPSLAGELAGGPAHQERGRQQAVNPDSP